MWAKNAIQESHLHSGECEGVCEGMNPHIHKWIPTLKIGVHIKSQIFKEWFQGSKLIGLKTSLYHWKVLETYMSKMKSHGPFEYLKHKLWLRERSGIKVSIWLPTTKSWELPWFTFMQMAWHISLKNYQQGLQFYFKPHLNRRSTQEVLGFQNSGSPNFENFGTFNLGVPRKMTFGCSPHG